MNDWKNIKKLNERYGLTNLTGFKLITEQSPKEVLNVIERDIEIFNNTNVDYRYVTRLIVRENAIDLCIRDNTTAITYYFLKESDSFEGVVAGLEEVCSENRIDLEVS